MMDLVKPYLTTHLTTCVLSYVPIPMYYYLLRPVTTYRPTNSYYLAVIGATVAVIGEPTSTTRLLPATLPA